MTLFLHHPEQDFYVRELTRSIDTQINAVRREISNLVEMGLIVEHVAKDEPGVKRPGLKRKYYRANQNFPLSLEIRALLTKANVIMEWQLEAKLRELGEVKYAVLSGIFMGLKNHPVDLFVVGEVDKVGLKRLVNQMEKELGVEINYTCLPAKEFTYRVDMADRFLKSVLDAPKTVLVDELDSKEPVR